MKRVELIAMWKARRKELRRQVHGDPVNRQLLYARADELKRCIEELAAVPDVGNGNLSPR